MVVYARGKKNGRNNEVAVRVGFHGTFCFKQSIRKRTLKLETWSGFFDFLLVTEMCMFILTQMSPYSIFQLIL